jgi:uncharacterized membrane protein YgcG
MTSNDDKANPTGYSEKSEGGIAETTCPKCGSSQVAQHPLTGEWTCLYCRAKWGATQTKVVSVDDENAVRGADIAIDRVFVCPNCGGKDLKQDGYTGKWMCQDCRGEFLDVDARMVVVEAGAAQRKNDLVIDTANLLTDAQEADLLAYFRSIESQMVVAVETANTVTENVEYFARRRAQELGVGRDDSDNGVYILVVLDPRRIQIVTGNGIAPKVSAADLNRISSQSIAPRFKAGDYVQGLKAGAAEILRLYTNPSALRQGTSTQAPAGGLNKRIGRSGCLIVLATLVTIIGGCFGLANWYEKQPRHKFTRVTAQAGICFDHYYVYDKATKTHALSSKTAVPAGNCVREERTSHSCSEEMYTTYDSVDWKDVALSSRKVTGDFCASTSSDSNSDGSSSDSSSFGGGDYDSGSSGGSSW